MATEDDSRKRKAEEEVEKEAAGASKRHEGDASEQQGAAEDKALEQNGADAPNCNAEVAEVAEAGGKTATVQGGGLGEAPAAAPDAKSEGAEAGGKTATAGQGDAPAAAPAAAAAAGAGTGSPVLDAVVSAIRHLKSHKGSSLKAIQKVCAEQFGFQDGDEVKAAVKSGAANGTLTQVKASYLVTGDPAYEDTAEKVSIEEKAPGEGGRKVVKGDTVRIAYVGTLADGGNKFDEGSGFEFEVGGGDVIKGMDAGVLGMAVGGRRLVTIPPSLGYGKRGSKPDIPPNATLVFDITLEAIE